MPPGRVKKTDGCVPSRTPTICILKLKPGKATSWMTK